ncbi:MAG: hypothetical protein RMJ82_12110, partial [Gemmatales bacterium]|nr:hypothetical protein [Gemmatales bacterium]
MKIGLVAIGGVSTLNPRLIELGMRLPALRRRAEVTQSLPSLGLLMLAACTPPEHEVRYYEVPFGRDEPAELYDCDLVAMTELTTQAQNAYVLAERLRR